MAEKKTFWMGDGYGAKALVVGVDERDRWLPRGWAEADEPAGADRVWMRHAEHGGRAQFAAGAVEQWRALGWEPSSPPEPVDVLHDQQLVDTQPVPEPAKTTTSRKTEKQGE